jgi:hypothetical protein
MTIRGTRHPDNARNIYYRRGVKGNKGDVGDPGPAQDISELVPYTGADQDIDIGDYFLTGRFIAKPG